MIDQFLDRQAVDADLFELEDVETGEKRQYRIVSKAAVTQEGTPLSKATFDPILAAILGKADASALNSYATTASLAAYAKKTDLSGFLTAEAGAYTPYISNGHTNVGCTYEIQQGQYYRIGKLCFASIRLKGVITQSDQNACVTLPFPPDISQVQRFCFSLGEVVNATSQAVTSAETIGEDNRAIFFLQNGGKIVKWNVTGESFWFQASGCYITQ